MIRVLDETIAAFVQRLQGGLAILSSRVPRILEDPRSYQREAMLLALIAVLLVCVVLFAAYAIYDSIQTRRARQRMGLRVRRGGRLYRIAAACLVLSVIIFGLSVAPLVPALGGLCGGCHAVEMQVASWREGSHEAVSCYGCHAAPGLGGAVAASFSGARNAIGFSVGTGASDAIHDAGCLSCHKEIEAGVSTGGVRMRHSDVIDAGMSCLTCHYQVAHEQVSARESSVTVASDSGAMQRSTMSVCLICHDGVTARAECDVCHEGRPFDRASQSIGGGTDLQVVCVGCHKEETDRACVECHGLVLPHPASFMRIHAALSAEDPQLCADCHESASRALACSCHDANPNLHGTYSEWFPRHGPAAAAGGPGGCNCHRPSFCAKCHDGWPFPQ